MKANSLLKRALLPVYEHGQVSLHHEFNRVGRLSIHEVTDPAMARAVLQSRDMVLPSFVKKGLAQIIGEEALITSEGDGHRKVFGALATLFKPGGVGQNISPMILREAGQMVERWLDEKKPVDLEMEMRELTGGTITQVMFGDSITKKQSNDIIHAATVEVNVAEPIPALILAGRAVGRDWGHPNKPSRALRDGVEMVNGIFDGILKDRRALQKQPDDVLGRLIEVTDPVLTDTQIKYQLLMIVFAGHDTTSVTATFGLRELTKHPDEMEKLRRAIAGADVTPAGLQKMGTVQNAINETLRLYAPAYRLAREATADVTLNGYGFKKGELVRIDVQSMQRSADFWTDPDAFKPDRHDTAPKRPALLAFGAGMHQCLGQVMAGQVLTAIFAKVCPRVDFKVERDITGTHFGFTQRPEGAYIVLPQAR